MENLTVLPKNLLFYGETTKTVISSVGKVERERDKIFAVSKNFYSNFLFDHNDGFG